MSQTRPVAKDKALQIIRDQPDDSSFDDLIRELMMHRSIERGIADADAGRVLTNEQMKREIESWRS